MFCVMHRIFSIQPNNKANLIREPSLAFPTPQLEVPYIMSDSFKMVAILSCLLLIPHPGPVAGVISGSHLKEPITDIAHT